jgi:valyl-tRNA synthetase
MRDGHPPDTDGAIRSANEFDVLLCAPRADLGAQRRRIDREIDQLARSIANSYRQLEDPAFVDRAPAHIVESVRRKLLDYETQMVKSRAALERISTE